MLVLRRSPNQSIMVGDDITVTLLHRSGSRIRIRVIAPGSRFHGKEVDLRYGESLQIGTGISVRYLGEEKAQTKLGLEAPTKVKILRSELLQYRSRIPRWKRVWRCCKKLWS